MACVTAVIYIMLLSLGNVAFKPVLMFYCYTNLVYMQYFVFCTQTQRAHGSGITNIEIFSNLTLLRQEPSFQWGKLEIALVDDVLFYVRQAEGFPGFLVAINFGPRNSTVDFVGEAPKPDLVPARATVAATTQNFDSFHRAQEFEVGREVALDKVYIKAKEGAVFKWKAVDVPGGELYQQEL